MTTYKVAILGQDTYENVSKVKKHLYNWKENFGDSLEIVSGGGKYGVEKNVRDICIELALDPPRRKPARDFLNICRAEYDRLIEQSPNIPMDIIRRFAKKFNNIEFNKPEILLIYEFLFTIQG